MVKAPTAATVAGIVAGILSVGLTFYAPSQLQHWGTFASALAVLLVADSVLTVVSPRVLFYSVALLAALLGVVEWLGSGSGVSPWTLLVLVAVAVAVVLGIVAARHEPSVEEESHPMNLPVFG